MMSYKTPSGGSASCQHRFITEYYQHVRVSNYVDQFNEDPLRLSNPRILWDECQWAQIGRNHVLVKKQQSPSGEVVPAEVRLMGEISEDRFKLFVDGGWEGHYDDGIEKARATGRLGPGRIPQVAGLWPTFMETLHEIVMARGPTRPGRQFPLIENGQLKLRHKIFTRLTPHSSERSTPLSKIQGTPSFDLKHEETSTPRNSPKRAQGCLPEPSSDVNAALSDSDAMAGGISDFVDIALEMPDPETAPKMFESQLWEKGRLGGRETNADDASVASDNISEFSNVTRREEEIQSVDGEGADEGSSSGDDIGPEYEPANWVCGTDKAQDALAKLLRGGEYIGRPLPVFTLDGSRVPPAEYESKLKGALVDVTVTISNVTYKQWGFFADIVSIVIIAPPGYGPMDVDTTKRVKKHMSKPVHLKKFLASEAV